MPASPSPLNYFVGKGTIAFTPTGGSQRDLGNAPEIELTPEIEKLDHFSSRAGVRSKDRSIVLEKSATLRVVLDEITTANLALALLGTVTTNTAGQETMEIFADSEITGAIQIVGTNDVGNKFTIDLPSVSFQPSAGVNFISDEFGTIEITGEVQLSGGSFGTITRTAEGA